MSAANPQPAPISKLYELRAEWYALSAEQQHRAAGGSLATWYEKRANGLVNKFGEPIK